MLPKDDLTQRMLDHLYGLLDGAEAEAVRAQLATQAGQAALKEAQRLRDLLSAAAKLPFPGAKFAAPVAETSPQRHSPQRGWVGWVVAASLLFAVGIPTAAHVISVRRLDRAAELAREEAAIARAAFTTSSDEWNQTRTAATAEFEAAKVDFLAKRENLENDYKRVLGEVRKQPINLVISGPRAVTPGAPNFFSIETRDWADRAAATKIAARVIDQSGRVVFDDGQRETRGLYTLKLPADLPLTPDRDLKLEVSAAGAGEIKQSLPLAPPVYFAHLATDKPLYQPGEKVYYRALVLDRFRLQPPKEDLVLNVALLDPQGAEIFTTTGQCRADRDKGESRAGIAAGEYSLPDSVAGGEYTLRLRDTSNRMPEQTRKVLVNRYQPAQLQKELEFTRKSYGPGDEVVAACKVSRVSGPVAGQPVKAEAQVDGQNLAVEVSGKTDPQGAVSVKFRLPATIDRGDASVTVTMTDGGAVESLSKPVPVVIKKMMVEFFPEGGDLIAGLANTVYFQARTPLGKPAELRGRLVDGQGNTVAQLETLTDDTEPGINQGQGRFAFTSAAGTTYKVEVDQPAGLTAAIDFPAVKPEGVVLTAGAGVTADDQPFTVEVASAGVDRTLVVGAYARGRLLDHHRLVAPAGKAQQVVFAPSPGFGGVTRITVFAESGEGAARKLIPMAERLVYRKPTKQALLRVEPERNWYAPGDSVKLRLSATNEKGQPVPAVAMLGVVNQSVVTMADEKTFRTMPTHLLLTAEVEKAEDFEHVDVLLGSHLKAGTALDLLLGVQGWRRFKEQGPEVPKHNRLNETNVVTAPVVRIDSETAADQALAGKVQEAQARFEKAETNLAQVRSAPPELDRNQHEMQRAEAAAAAAIRERDERSATAREVARNLLPLILAIGLTTGIAWLCIGLIRDDRLPAGAFGSLALAGAACLGFFMIGPGPVHEKAHDDVAMATLKDADRSGGEPAKAKVAEADLGMVPVDKPLATPAAPELVVADGRPAEAKDAMRAILAKPAAPASPAVAPPPAAAKSIVMATSPRPAGGVAAKPDGTKSRVVGEPTNRKAAEKELPGGMAGRGGRAELPARIPPANLGGRTGLVEELDRRRGDGIYPADPKAQEPFIVREFAHHHKPAPDGVRDDFTETVYWHPALFVPRNGETVSFDLADSVTRYQVLAAVHTGDGRLGATKTEIAARKPLTVEPKLPVEITAGDRLDVPVTIANETDRPKLAKLSVESPGLSAVGPPPILERTIEGGARERRLFGFRPLLTEGTARLRFTLAGEDAIEAKLPVVAEGFPVAGSISEQLRGSANHVVTLPATWVAGTLKCEVALFPTPLADLQRGLEGLLREPYGCFEQTSTTNYPNTLILDYLRETNQADPQAVAAAKGMLDRGYARLASFEVPAANKREGYEWFGHAPAHEALTAYGLLQFRDMARVADVDPAMIARTRTFLMSRKDGHGGFQRSPAALDSFGRASEQTTNAYIVWAISESDKVDDLTAELDRLEREAKSASDPYFLALVANALLNRNRVDAAVAVLAKLRNAQAADGSLQGSGVSITGSRGNPLKIETTALVVLAWLKADRPGEYGAALRNAVKWLGQQRNGGGAFGPTQSTILALKALVAYARANKQPPELGEVSLTLGNRVLAKAHYTAATRDAIVLEVPEPEKWLKPGENKLKVSTTGKNLYPYTLAWSYNTLQPPSAAGCAVKLATALERNELAEGDSTRLRIMCENVSGKGQGMTTAIIGLPAGLKLPDDFKQLKDLARPRDGKAGPIAAWELRGRELILYWRDFAPNARVELALDVLAHVPGEYRGPASRAYLYYDPESKWWAAPLSAKINAK